MPGRNKGEYGSIVAGILDTLRDFGPMTATELCREMGCKRSQFSAVIYRMSRPTKTIPKRLYICGWTHDDEKGRRYPRAIFDIGSGKDAKAVLDSKIDVNRRSYSQKRMRNVSNSVFNLGLTRREFRL